MRPVRVLCFLLVACPLIAQVRRETHFTTTSDGKRVALHRVRPAELVPGREPVICLPGFIENHRIYDLERRHSLAEYLAQDGLDTWIVEYRGTGESWKPPVWDIFGWRFSVDDFMHEDLTAAVQYVLSETGSPQVFLLGHSMGGLNCYGYCVTEPRAQVRVKGIVTLAGAGKMAIVPSMRPLTVLLFLLCERLEPYLPWDMQLPTGLVFNALERLPGLRDAANRFLLGAIGAVVWSTSNMSQTTIETMLRQAVSDISMNVPKQFLRWIAAGQVCTFGPSPWWTQEERSRWYESHGFLSYTEALRRVRVPALVMVGGDDQIVPQENCRYCYDRLASVDKTFMIVDRRHGMQVDVGHEDILVGDQSETAVYPMVRWWLLSHATR